MTISNKFFVGCSGELFDTSKPDWHKLPALRPVYAQHFSTITTTAELLASVRAGEHAGVGGYRLAFIANDGGVLSYKAVKDNIYNVINSTRHRYRDVWQIVGLLCVDECESPIYCDHTGELLN